MNNDSIIFIGLDTHKSFIQVAVLQGHRGAQPQHLGRIKSNKSALVKLALQLQSNILKLPFILSMRLDHVDTGLTACSQALGTAAMSSLLHLSLKSLVTV
ncbi:hypothetical protein VIBHAR_02602 [Vibrio campbellii ATCC BAA-1116]|uniref:Uncharacterized protein n=1 Tax=Vibrio campbellii (strain ATCC BAA-1116) TaxID=2902295 RepID=A7MSI2_VIBC1|nr:hypothetical protein VIBHAR_02602 [Vibrio campbellii ATCC BAA-1116]